MIQMILESKASKISNGKSRVAVKISKLIRFNSVKQRRGPAENARHCITNEAPLPVAVAQMIYLKTRKKVLVNETALEELCVQHQRVEDIQWGISHQLWTKYNNDEIISPPKLKPGLFVTSAIDNISHNLSSYAATSSFHGTSISILQHPDDPIQHLPFAFVSENTSTRRNKLPSAYADIKPTRRGKREPLKFKSSSYEFPSQHNVTTEISVWI